MKSLIHSQTSTVQPLKFWNEPLVRYVNLRVAHAPEMSGTFYPPQRVSDPDTHHGMCVTHAPWCMPESMTGGFLWSRWRGKHSRHSRCMRNPLFFVSAERQFHPIYNWTCEYLSMLGLKLNHSKRSPWWDYSLFQTKLKEMQFPKMTS